MAKQFICKATYSKGNCATIRVEDCRRFLASIPSASTQLVLTSPPYNIGKSYERQKSSVKAYVDLQRVAIQESVRILKKGGSLCWQVGNYVNGDGQIIPLDMLLWSVFSEFVDSRILQLRNRIVWHFEHGLHCQKRFSGRHEAILWFTKGDKYKFSLDPLRVPQKYPGKRAYKGPRKGEITGNPLGKNPGDVWAFPNVKANHVEKTEHPCQFPIELAERLILCLTDRNNLVVDPFAGVGSTLVASVLHGRRAAGCDVSARYVELAKERMRSAASGSLKYRAFSTPISIPVPGTQVATAPPGFFYPNRAS